jgi:hypothetical protein
MKDLTEHCKVVQEVLNNLCKHKLYLHPDKCDFKVTCIEFLSLIVSEGKVEMDPVKVEGVVKWPVLCSKKEVQQLV